MRSFYDNFLSELKQTQPGKWYGMAKRIGAVDQPPSNEVGVQCLSGVNKQQAAEKIADHFAAVSNEYSAINFQKLPSN